MTGAAGPQATRSFSTTTVAPGGELVVTIDLNNISIGKVVETLPAGFSYVAGSSSLPSTAVSVTGQQVSFTVLAASSFTYTVTASNSAGSYSFSGVLTDANLSNYPVGGASVIVVGDAPGVSVSHATTSAPVRINTPIPLMATFSEPVNGFTVDDITVANGDVSNFVGSDGDSVFTFDVTPNAVGVVTVDIPSGAATDSDGEANTAAERLTLGLPYDDDHDGLISASEVLRAVADFFSDRISAGHVLQIVALFFTSSN